MSLWWGLKDQGAMAVIEQGFHFLNRNFLSSLTSIDRMLVAASAHDVPRIAVIRHSVLLLCGASAFVLAMSGLSVEQ